MVNPLGAVSQATDMPRAWIVVASGISQSGHDAHVARSGTINSLSQHLGALLPTMANTIPLSIHFASVGYCPTPLPAYATSGSAGMDLAASMNVNGQVALGVGERALIKTGWCVAIPEGYEGQVRSRSATRLLTSALSRKDCVAFVARWMMISLRRHLVVLPWSSLRLKDSTSMNATMIEQHQ